jgi:hydroxyacylglutathione hydrolase
MINVKRFVCESFDSNTYLLSSSTSKAVWLIDAGCTSGIIDGLNSNQYIECVFITHAHFDHIFQINEIVNRYPECRIYGSVSCLENLSSSKANLSWYRDIPVELQKGETNLIQCGDIVHLSEEISLMALHTPGHTEDSMTFFLENYVFTGDAYIPFLKTITKLKSGNKDKSLESLRKIASLCDSSTIISPGHGNTYLYSDTDLKTYLL